MFFKFVLLSLLLRRSFAVAQEEDLGFTFNGFQGVNMSLDGLAQITDNGLLMLVNATEVQTGHAFYPHPFHFINQSTGNVLSFSSTFVFAMFSELTTIGGPGIVFVLAPTKGLPGGLPSNYIGLFNTTNIGKSSNHVVGVELDSLESKEFDDINANHVGIDFNDLKSVISAPASYFTGGDDRFVNLSLSSGHPLQLWVEYCSEQELLSVTLAPVNIPKPRIPLLSLKTNLSQIIVDPMFVGFSSATTALHVAHYVMGWSFKINGEAKELTLSQLPKLPRRGPKGKVRVSNVALPIASASLVLIAIFVIQFIVKRKQKFAEVLEDWEFDYGPHRFKYKDLYIATKGFKDKELLGTGGFGRVYRGVLPTSKAEVAVKRVSHDSRQGMREFIAEIVSIGKLRHRSIVPLLGYCRRKGELLLVYDFMPNGSLDKFLFDQSTRTRLSWSYRFRIIKRVASALLYLHEEWEQVVVHRDVKSSNVLLDKELNGRLGDFGLARLYDHGTDPQSTCVVGTRGYLAPELSKTGKAKPSVDVYAFGALMLEVACGRRPIEPQPSEEYLVLVDWVFSCWIKGEILEAADPKLGFNYVVEEMELVLKLGLFCSQSSPTARPCMRQVVRYLEREVPLPELSSLPMSSEGSSDLSMWCLSYHGSIVSPSASVAESVLSGAR